jgi:hypothetical protein
MPAGARCESAGIAAPGAYLERMGRGNQAERLLFGPPLGSPAAQRAGLIACPRCAGAGAGCISCAGRGLIHPCKRCLGKAPPGRCQSCDAGLCQERHVLPGTVGWYLHLHGVDASPIGHELSRRHANLSRSEALERAEAQLARRGGWLIVYDEHAGEIARRWIDPA